MRNTMQEKTQSKRLFISIDMPLEVQKIIEDLQRQLKRQELFRGTFVQPEHVHLTLKFFGDVDVQQIESIQSALKSIKVTSFKAHLGSLGVFPHEGHINIIWLNVINHAFTELATQINAAVSSWSSADARPFVAHMTLVRIKSVTDRHALLDYLHRIKIPPIEFMITQFCFKESQLYSTGPVHSTLACYNLEKL